ncbi:TrmB family transcriptional regulator [Natranaeroarchaeum aerophilus]|uniref:TrmB family transcriptional regulator n=1 Tax=Natranaeroarchaeum aerophilus TaxID=2917711 RepID=A0AAE3FR51_9EURY|nr:helix-turn-helix domain-containing protein [Natranaeroarchaeum aerophilus]MCL9813094.1 TrmB family transcriptional regulator [Natranaeroarchaeum aerophilus]
MNESDAIESLERLGLTSYEAKVFIALQKLGGGTAREVHQITDVPRSQVYSVADGLADRGLVEVQQSNPIQYRPVSIDEARETLRSRFEREQQQAFDYVEQVQREHDDGQEKKEAIWTLRGRERIDARTREIIDGAESRIVFGTGDLSILSEAMEQLLRERAADGLSVLVISESQEVRAVFADDDRITVVQPPMQYDEENPAGRIVLGDWNALLMSVTDEEAVDPSGEETAIWSVDTSFATMLSGIIEANLGIE